MRRILSLPGLAVAVWVSCLAFMGLLGGMVAVLAWHPHFLPATTALALVIVTGSALIAGALWRIVRSPDRRRALSCLLVGVAPLWFLTGLFLYGLAVGTGRKTPFNPAIKLLAPLAESLMDLEARFVYPQRTAGEKIVMISAPMPEAEARAQVDAMDRHIRALEVRLGRKTRGTVHWVRGPLLGIERHAVLGLCMGSRPGEEPSDAEGLGATDRHEVAHCVLTSHCSPRFDPPAVLTEGWAQPNQGTDPVDQARSARDNLSLGNGFTLRQFTGPDWYDRHDWLVYLHGAPFVNFILRRFGPERFLQLYTTCSQSTFESDCRRILGLDLDGLDAAYPADVERMASPNVPVELRRLERLRLAPDVDAARWKAFLADYCDAAARMLAPYHHIRLTTFTTRSADAARGQLHPGPLETRCLLRSGEFASNRVQWAGRELAFLAHPRRSIVARRDAPDRPWVLDDESKWMPEQSHHRALNRMESRGFGRSQYAAPLIALSWDLADHFHEGIVVAGLERFTEDGRPRVRVRIEDRSPAGYVRWRGVTYILAADDLYAVQSDQFEGVGQDKETYRSEYAYDRHEGIPVLRSMHTTATAPAGEGWTSELKVVECRFGPIPEEEFDPDRFLDGPRVAEAVFDPYAREPSMLERWFWVPLPIGALGLACGAVMSFGARRGRGRSTLDPPTSSPPHMKTTLVALAVLGLGAGSSTARAERMSYLDNGSVRIGVDLDIGGTITFLSRSKDGANLINSHDLGRQVQQSYYSGPHPFGRAHPGWKGWPWNPIGSGDVYDHPSRVIEHSNDGKTLYVETIPMQWALNNVPGECTFETRITLEQAAAYVRCRLNNNRPDRTHYPAHDQELPALYTIGKLHRLFTYDGDHPFEGQPLKQVRNAGPPWTNWKATENWAALVDDRGIGVGVIHPGVYSFIGGFHGRPNTGGPKDDPTGYIAPVRKEVLDHNIDYEYRYILAVGTLEDIRAAASANRVEDTRPDDRFDRDRRHWTFHNARDGGFPIAGGLRIRTTGDDPQLMGPEQWWRAQDMPKLFIRAAFRTRGDRAEIFWSVPGQGFSPDQRVGLTIRPDGILRTYQVDLAAAPAYRGTITGLRLDPPAADRPGDEVRLESISWRPE